ncbi:MAG: hypothetical protein IH941_03560 [Acidobacteria bacterium]|nr:hypothetical protein [Acidobacteriota bacterium]
MRVQRGDPVAWAGTRATCVDGVSRRAMRNEIRAQRGDPVAWAGTRATCVDGVSRRAMKHMKNMNKEPT